MTNSPTQINLLDRNSESLEELKVNNKFMIFQQQQDTSIIEEAEMESSYEESYSSSSS
jgi:hypothetical protein